MLNFSATHVKKIFHEFYMSIREGINYMLNSISTPHHLSSLKTQISATSPNMKGVQHPINQQSYQPNFQGAGRSALKLGALIAAFTGYFTYVEPQIIEPMADAMAIRTTTHENNPNLSIFKKPSFSNILEAPEKAIPLNFKNIRNLQSLAQSIQDNHDRAFNLFTEVIPKNQRIAAKECTDSILRGIEDNNLDTPEKIVPQLQDCAYDLLNKDRAAVIHEYGKEGPLQEGRILGISAKIEDQIDHRYGYDQYTLDTADGILRLDSQPLFKHKSGERKSRIKAATSNYLGTRLSLPFAEAENKAYEFSYNGTIGILSDYMKYIKANGETVGDAQTDKGDKHKTKVDGISKLLGAESDDKTAEKITEASADGGLTKRVIKFVTGAQTNDTGFHARKMPSVTAAEISKFAPIVDKMETFKGWGEGTIRFFLGLGAFFRRKQLWSLSKNNFCNALELALSKLRG